MHKEKTYASSVMNGITTSRPARLVEVVASHIYGERSESYLW